MKVLNKVEGVWLGDIDGKRVVIIDVDVADPDAIRMIDDFISERRRNNGRRNAEALVRQDREQDVAL